MPARSTLLSLLLALPLVALTSCVSSDGAAKTSAEAKPVEVAVITLQPTSVTLTRELPGRVAARRVSEVRARVDGII
jgi:membrane fusion protein (multidrug efflux system)